MRKLLNWLFGWPLIRSKSPCYVVVYDSGGDDTDGLEEYYGYFSSPWEARRMWRSYAGPYHQFTNVKLCLVVEDWS